MTETKPEAKTPPEPEKEPTIEAHEPKTNHWIKQMIMMTSIGTQGEQIKNRTTIGTTGN